MKLYHSTRNMANTATSNEAVLRGIAPDGGLYVPDEFTKLDIGQMCGKSAYEIFAMTLSGLIDIFTKTETEAIVEKGYAGRFETSDVTPLVKVGDCYILELFRGPTSAFKDIALSLLPYYITGAAKNLGVNDEIRILTATSGDTGKAALAGFANVPGTSVTVFYPDGGVSAVQRSQMVTQTGNNVHVCAVRGNFDDAQTGVKAIFGDAALNTRLNARGVRLSSANSINLGRLAPQVGYYFKAYMDLVRIGAVKMGGEVNFVVPTGNFGDILAGEYARRMGLPVGKLICASNANRVLTDFITTGVYDRRRKFVKTASPSMDILVSSNLERCLHLMSGGDCALICDLMAKLKDTGVYTAPESLMRNLNESFWAGFADDSASFDALRYVYQKLGYLMDTHTSVGWKVMENYRERTGDNRPTVLLATASPYKFASDVLTALGVNGINGFDALNELRNFSGVPIPTNLEMLRNLPELHKDIANVSGMAAYVEAIQV